MQRHEDLWYTMRYTNVCIMGITEKKVVENVQKKSGVLAIKFSLKMHLHV